MATCLRPGYRSEPDIATARSTRSLGGPKPRAEMKDLEGALQVPPGQKRPGPKSGCVAPRGSVVFVTRVWWGSCRLRPKASPASQKVCRVCLCVRTRAVAVWGKARQLAWPARQSFRFFFAPYQTFVQTVIPGTTLGAKALDVDSFTTMKKGAPGFGSCVGLLYGPASRGGVDGWAIPSARFGGAPALALANKRSPLGNVWFRPWAHCLLVGGRGLASLAPGGGPGMVFGKDDGDDALLPTHAPTSNFDRNMLCGQSVSY